MTTPSGKLLLVATLGALSASAGALASAPRGAAPGRAPVTATAPAPAATCTDAPTPPPRRRHLEVEGCTENPPPAHVRSKVFHQLRYHSQFPATRTELLAGFRATAELTADELAWVTDHLPAAALTSAARTMSRLFPDAPAHVLSRLATPPVVATLATR